jgi:hypothetical protein
MAAGAAAGGVGAASDALVMVTEGVVGGGLDGDDGKEEGGDGGRELHGWETNGRVGVREPEE